MSREKEAVKTAIRSELAKKFNPFLTYNPVTLGFSELSAQDAARVDEDFLKELHLPETDLRWVNLIVCDIPESWRLRVVELAIEIPRLNSHIVSNKINYFNHTATRIVFDCVDLVGYDEQLLPNLSLLIKHLILLFYIGISNELVESQRPQVNRTLSNFYPSANTFNTNQQFAKAIYDVGISLQHFPEQKEALLDAFLVHFKFAIEPIQVSEEEEPDERDYLKRLAWLLKTNQYNANVFLDYIRRVSDLYLQGPRQRVLI